MSNQGFYKNPDFGTDDDKNMSDGFASIVDKNDFLLNYLNDFSNAQLETRNHQNIYNPFGSDFGGPFSGYQDLSKGNDHLNGHMPKMNPQHDAWLLQTMQEGKTPYGASHLSSYQNNQNYEDFDLGIKTKKVKATRESGSRRIVEEPDLNSKAGMKSNIKNTYINKIQSLITTDSKSPVDQNDEDSDSPMNRGDSSSKKNMNIKKEADSGSNGQKGMKKIRSYDVLKSDELDKLNQKLARNRESARESRKRKKVYIELLEKKVETLTQELITTRKQLELNNSSMNKMTFQSKMMNNFVTGKQQLFDRLEKVIQGGDDTEINLLIDSLRLRLGATGKERINAINYFFRQVIDLLMPVHMKYLLWVASEGKDLFSSKDTTLLHNLPTNLINSTGLQNEVSDYWNDLVTNINLSETQKKSIQKYRKKLCNEKQKFEGLLVQLNQCRKNILKQSNSLQNVIDDFRNILTPVQTGKFLIIVDRERNRKEFTPEKLWQILGMKKEDDDDEEGESSEGTFDGDDSDTKGNKSRKLSSVTDNPAADDGAKE